MIKNENNRNNNEIEFLSLDVKKLNQELSSNKKESLNKIEDYLQMLDYENEKINKYNFKNPLENQFQIFKFVDKPVIEEKKEEILEKRTNDKKEENKEITNLINKKEENKPPISLFDNIKKEENKQITNSINKTGGKEITSLFGNKNIENKIPTTTTATNKEEEDFKNMLSNKNLFPTMKTTTQKEEPIKKELKPELPKEVIQIPKKEEIILNTPPIVPIQPKSITFKSKLLQSANNYWNNRNKRQEIPKKDKIISGKIILKINPIIDQLYTLEDIPLKTKTIKELFLELYKNKLYDLYDFAMNYLCQGILTKSEKYIKEHKSKFIVYSKFIYEITNSNKLLADFYLMIICYKCPYVIPIQFTEKDFKDKETYMKRLGYSDPNETIINWNSNMECYAYLYWAFLAQDNSYNCIVEEYLTNLETEVVNYPLATVFKAFLNTLGRSIKNNIKDGIVRLKKIVGRFVKELENLKSKSKNVNLKEITSENIYFIKKYYHNINTGTSTDMYTY